MTEVKKVFSGNSSGSLQGEGSLTSDREKEIMHLVVQGYRDCDIAERLSINELAVREDLHNLFDKFAVSNRLELALYAIHHRLMDQSDPQLPGERGPSFSLGCRIQNAWVGLRRRFRKT
jgi:DNA-binding CsgD family transcriptional regulator